MIIQIRNRTGNIFYRSLLKPVFFKIDPEIVHNNLIGFGKFLSKCTLSKKTTSLLFNYKNPVLEQNLLGINFKNPVGLSAGFDKNAELLGILGDIGFGFAEVGSVTAKKYGGNDGVRIKRLPDKSALWINLGLNNNGVDEIASRLSQHNYGIPYGISVAPTNCRENLNVNNAIADYLYSINRTEKLGSYLTLNLSCPNAEGSQMFLDPINVEKLLKNVNSSRPIFLKLSPDLKEENIDKILKIAHKYKISGLICTNLTKKHSMGKGGISGKYVEKYSDNLLKYVYQQKIKNSYKFILVGVGGIFSAEDAYKKIKLGANLVQLITGMVYKGPGLISEINQGLVNLLRNDGYSKLSDAVGKSC